MHLCSQVMLNNSTKNSTGSHTYAIPSFIVHLKEYLGPYILFSLTEKVQILPNSSKRSKNPA